MAEVHFSLTCDWLAKIHVSILMIKLTRSQLRHRPELVDNDYNFQKYILLYNKTGPRLGLSRGGCRLVAFPFGG